MATRKVTAATVTAIVVSAGGLACDLLGITVPVSLAAVLTGLLTSGVAYLIPEGPTGRPDPPGQHRAP